MKNKTVQLGKLIFCILIFFKEKKYKYKIVKLRFSSWGQKTHKMLPQKLSQNIFCGKNCVNCYTNLFVTNKCVLFTEIIPISQFAQGYTVLPSFCPVLPKLSLPSLRILHV